jgi:hypothetical protein
MDREEFDAFMEGALAAQERLRAELANYEGGRTRAGERVADGAWNDVTSRRIGQIKAEIVSIDRTIAFVTALRKGAND